MTATSRALARRMAETAAQAPVARLPEDLWRRGRRRHRRRVVTVAAAVAAAVLTALSAVPVTGALRPPPAATGEAGGAVPARVYQPWPWQATVRQSPRGPAALLVSGGTPGYSSVDWPGSWGSKIGAVGRDGSYRMLRYSMMRMQASQDALLSPDGRYVVGNASLERLSTMGDPAELTVADLTTGRVRRYRDAAAAAAHESAFPMAWSPDGRRLLVRRYRPPAAEQVADADPPFDGQTSVGWPTGTVWLLDLASGDSRRLFDLGRGLPRYAAFAPDGRSVALQVGRSLVRIDTATGTGRTLAELPAAAQLAGAGAWRPDGAAIAVFSVTSGCVEACSERARNARHWRLEYLDATTGATSPGAGGAVGAASPGAGFAEVTGAAVRIAGWQRDGTAVVVRYLDTDDDSGASLDAPESSAAVRDVDLLALDPRGGTRTLLRRPDHSIWDLDVAQDLIADGAFGGPAPKPSMFPPASWFWYACAVVAALLGAPFVLTVWLVRRRRGRRPIRDQDLRWGTLPPPRPAPLRP